MNLMYSLVLSAILCSAPAAYAAPHSTAAEVSKLLVSGLKIGLLVQSDVYDSNCVTRIPEGAAESLAQEFISSSLSSNELIELDDFYASELGQRFNADVIAEKSAKLGNTSYEPSSFSPSERDLIGKTVMSSAGDKLFSLISGGNQDFMAAFQAIANTFMQQCRVAR